MLLVASLIFVREFVAGEPVDPLLDDALEFRFALSVRVTFLSDRILFKRSVKLRFTASGFSSLSGGLPRP